MVSYDKVLKKPKGLIAMKFIGPFKFRTSLLSHSMFDIWNVKKYGASRVELRIDDRRWSLFDGQWISDCALWNTCDILFGVEVNSILLSVHKRLVIPY